MSLHKTDKNASDSNTSHVKRSKTLKNENDSVPKMTVGARRYDPLLFCGKYTYILRAQLDQTNLTTKRKYETKQK